MTAKVLFYTHGLVDGGAERLWSCLATAFHERGFRVIFAQDFEADDNRSNLAAGIPLETLGANHFSSTLALARYLRKEKPDIVLSAVGGSNIKLLIAKMISRSPVRTIITYHGFREWKSGLLSLLTYLGLPVLSAVADRTVAVSDGLRDRLISKWGAKSNKTITILNPVFFPSTARVPTAGELLARQEIILAVGRFVPEKNFPLLIRAFALIKRPNAKLVILGKGPDKKLLLSEIKRHGLEDRVELPGYSKEPWAHYETARCFALPSISEPFGNVVVEALAFGLLVVATACSGPQEILLHGRYGRIVATHNELQLAHAMDAALDDTDSPMTRRTRADEFSFEARVPNYVNLVNEILNTQRATASASEPQHAADFDTALIEK